MSLPSASSIIKRARQDNPSDQLEKAYQAIVALIKETDPGTLCNGEGIEVYSAKIKELENFTVDEAQTLFGRVARNSGYIVSALVGKDDWVDVPAHIWAWPDFWKCSYDHFRNVWIRVEE